MEITITLRQSDLTNMVADMKETGKNYSGYVVDEKGSQILITLTEDAINTMLNEIGRVSKTENRSVIVDDLFNVDTDISFLLIPEYKQDVFKDLFIKE